VQHTSTGADRQAYGKRRRRNNGFGLEERTKANGEEEKEIEQAKTRLCGVTERASGESSELRIDVKKCSDKELNCTEVSDTLLCSDTLSKSTLTLRFKKKRAGDIAKLSLETEEEEEDAKDF